MKYFLTINQLILSDYPKIDIKDAAILDYLYFYCNSQNPKIIKNRVCEEHLCWTWVDYSSLIQDMPLLRIRSRGVLTKRIKTLKEAGFIKTKMLNNQKLYFRTTNKIDELFIKMNGAVHLKERIKK